MTPLRFTLPLIALLTLPACSDSVAVVVQRIQDTTVKICSYLPSAQSTLEIVKATSNVDVNVIAKAICDAVVAWKMGDSAQMAQGIAAPCPRVNGVCVEGTFVDKEGKPSGEPPKGE